VRYSRRSFCQVSFNALLAATALGACNKLPERKKIQDKESNCLNIYSWADYLDPATVPEFEKQHGIKVTYDTFASNEQLLAKLQAGATEYDIIMPTNYMVQELVRMKIIGAVDRERLPGLKDIMENFADPAYDRGLTHSVPQFWGTSGIAYNAASLGKNMPVPDDWDVFFDQRFANRMTLLDDARETIGMSLKHRGHSYNTRVTAEIESASADLIKQKPLVMCYTSDQVIVQLAGGDSLLSMAYSGDAFQAMKSNTQVRYVIPKSGTSLWLDSFCIPLSAPHLDNAYKWLNYMLRPEVAAANATFNRYATANARALPLLPEADRLNTGRYPSQSVLSVCEQLVDIEKVIFVYDRMWTELKCS
jgi:spermidine/putrescine transport system substrate-binding protein